MSGITIAQVRAWDPSVVMTTANGVEKAADDIERQVRRYRTLTHKVGEHWEGPAADHATNAMSTTTKTGTHLVETVKQSARLLRHAGRKLADARDALLATVSDALNDQMTVDEHTGKVTPVVIDSPILLAAFEPMQTTPYFDQIGVRCDRWQRSIDKALAAVVDADARAANALRDVELPTALARRAVKFLPQVDEVRDVSGTDGYLIFPQDYDPFSQMRPGTETEWLMAVGTPDDCDSASVASPTDLAEILAAGVPAGAFLVSPLGVNETMAQQPLTGYYGGGFIKGPDGRDYPMVVPNQVVDGRSYGANAFSGHEDDPTTLGGRDDGWRTVGKTTGRGLFGEPMGGTDKFTASGSVLMGTPVETPNVPERLDDLTVNETGYPGLAHGPGTVGPDPVPPVSDPRDNPVDAERAPLPPPGVHPETFAPAQSSVDLAGRVGNAALFATRADDHLEYGYQLELQENAADGRTRALLRTYQVWEQGGDLQIRPTYGWMDQRGSYRWEHLNFRFHGSEAVATPAGVHLHQGNR